MATPKTGNRLTDENNSLIDNINGQVSRSVVDEQGNDLLQQILTSLGGSTNTSPVITNINTLANTEVTINLPSNTKMYILKARGNSKIQLAYTVGESNTNFITIWPGAEWKDINLYQSQSIYIQTTKSDIIEIVTYV